MRFHKAILPGWPSRFLHPSNDASRSRSSSSTRMVVTTTRWWHWKIWMGILYSIQIFVIPSQLYSVLGKVPEASSTFLRMHRMYSQQPPHDTRLYDILQVTPNATLAQIQKSYRKLTKQLHPDKQRQHQLQQQQSSNTPNDKLQQVRQAYEVLKEDSTRLPYHRYGLLDVNHAAFLLTGAPTGEISTKEDQLSLLRLMGYDRIQSNHSQLPSSTSTSHQQRVFYIAANLLERMRPLVEGAISNTVLADSIAQECDRLKTLPLGAQIIRCIGRAYRHSGQRVLRKHQRKHNNSNKKRRDLFLPDLVRDQMRGAKQVLTAAAAGGRFVLTEQMTKARFSPPKQHLLSLECSALGELITDDDDLSSQLHSDEDLKKKEHHKAQQALLESLQIEALWKISKIDLDRTIQEACNLILDMNYFFFPTHQSPTRLDRRMDGDGWVTSTGKTIDATVGQMMAASALVLMGDVMVKCSKEGTSWID